MRAARVRTAVTFTIIGTQRRQIAHLVAFKIAIILPQNFVT